MEEQKTDFDGLSKMPHWQQMQYKSFRAWINYNLSSAGHPEIQALTVGLKDGMALVALLEGLSKQQLKGIQKNPKMRIHFINNLAQVFTFVKGVPIHIQSVMPEDIVDGNIKLILGFIWMLILHYQISKSALQVEEPKKEETPSGEAAPPPKPAPKEDPKMLLLARVNNYLTSHGLSEYQVKNFVDDWQSGLTFTALIYGEDKDLVDLAGSHGQQPLDVLRKAFGLYKEEWGLPRMLDAEDLVSSKPDEKSVMTFVSLILDAFASNRRIPKPKVEPPPPVIETPPPVVETPPPVVVETPPPKPRVPITSLHVRVAAARKLKKADHGDFSDPYCVLEVHNQFGKKGTGYDFKTGVIKATRDPVWNTDFSVHSGNVDLNEAEDVLVFSLMDWDIITKNDPIGYVKLPISRLEDGVLFDEWLPVHKHLHKDKKGHGQLHVVVAVNQAFLPILSSEPALLRVVSAKDLEGKDKGGTTSDPFVLIKIKGKKAGKRKTRVIKKNLNPEWEDEFEFVSGELTDGDSLQFIVFDWDMGSKNDPLGHAELFLGQTIKKGIIDVQLPLCKGKKGDKPGQGSLHVQLAYGEGRTLPPMGAPLSVRVAAAKDLRAADRSGYSDPYVVMKVMKSKNKNLKLKTQIVKQSLNPVWNEEITFEAGAVRAHRDVLAFHIYDWDKASKKDPLGIVHVPIAEIAGMPLFDRWLDVMDVKNPKAKGSGMLHVVASWGGALPGLQAALPVSIRIAEARGLLGADKSGTSDPYAELEIPGKKLPANKTPAIPKTLTPVWDADFEWDAGFVDVKEDVLNIMILDKDKVGENTPLGFVAFPLKRLIEQPLINEWLPLNRPTKREERGYGEVRIVATHGMPLPPAQEQLIVSIVGARGLRASDKGGTSDPYVIVKIPGKKSGRLVLKTEVVKKTLNPSWQQDFEFEMRDFSADDVIEFRVFDHDQVGENDPLGNVRVPFAAISAQTYHQNWFPVDQPKNCKEKATGDVYIRFGIGEEGRKRIQAAYGNVTRPAPIGGKDTKLRVSKEEAKQLKKEKEKDAKKQAAKGAEKQYNRSHINNLHLRVTAARNLPAADKGGTSDPYVEVTIKHTTTKFKTSTIKKTLNPVWNEEVDWSREGIDADQDVIVFSVFDWDRLSKNDLLGVIEIPAKELLTSDGAVVDRWLQLMDPQDHHKVGTGELHVQVAHGSHSLPPAEKKGKKEKKEKKEKKKDKKKDKKKKGK